MKTGSTANCHILLKGSTQEQSCTWENLRQRVESGDISPDTLLYREESQQWMPLASLPEFDDIEWDKPVEGDATVGNSENQAELKQEYAAAVQLARDQYDSLDHLTRAGRLALSLGRQEEAAAHFQRALELKPFNKRLATEVKRSFPPILCRTFNFLERRPAFWCDPVAAVAWPLKSTVSSLVIATATLSLLAILPYAQPLFWTVLLLLMVHTAIQAGERTAVPLPGDMTGLEGLFSNWRPFACFMLSAAVMLLPFILLVEILLFAEGAGHWNVLHYIKNSPLLTVALFTVAAIYLPAALMVSTAKKQKLHDAFALKRFVAIIIHEELEYLLVVTGVTAVALAWIGVGTLFSFVPVAGEIIASGAALYGALLIGYIIGRTRSRYRHLF